MSPTLTALAGSVLVLGWQGQSGSTYTVQSSSDCNHWLSQPVVIEGETGEMEFSIEITAFPAFLRLRSSTDGDSDENGLPDLWEWKSFGYLDVSPEADPDMDGLSNYDEWLSLSDPLDFYNGLRPVMQSGSGSEWIISRDAISRQSVVLRVLKPSGDPWPNAPVAMRIDSDRPAFLQAGDSKEAAAHEIIAYADDLGRISGYSHAIHLLGSSVAPTVETVKLTAGSSERNLLLRTVPEGYSGPPRDLKHEILDPSSGQITWTGLPGDSIAFVAEKKTAANDWIPLLELSSVDLPDPEGEKNRYSLTYSLNP